MTKQLGYPVKHINVTQLGIPKLVRVNIKSK